MIINLINKPIVERKSLSIDWLCDANALCAENHFKMMDNNKKKEREKSCPRAPTIRMREENKTK